MSIPLNGNKPHTAKISKAKESTLTVPLKVPLITRVRQYHTLLRG